MHGPAPLCRHLTGTLLILLVDVVRFLRLCLRPSTVLAAENLFLRKPLAFYQERHVKPRRTSHAARFTQALIRQLARDNPTWGQERLANELLLKLGLQVSPRTGRKYMPTQVDGEPGQHTSAQRWRTFVRHHAQAIVACDFCVVVTATFRLLYMLMIMEHATRRILHVNVTTHPTAQWTLQQLREAIPSDHGYRFLIHNRDSIFSQQLDQHMRNLGLRVLKTPPQSPQANALCERLVGTLRRECLDFVIPLTENHLRHMLKVWVKHYNEGRPHMSLGPGIPQLPPNLPVALQTHRHRLPAHLRVTTRPILGGLHHEYRVEKKAA
jgi:putative transposase